METRPVQAAEESVLPGQFYEGAASIQPAPPPYLLPPRTETPAAQQPRTGGRTDRGEASRHPYGTSGIPQHAGRGDQQSFGIDPERHTGQHATPEGAPLERHPDR